MNKRTYMDCASLLASIVSLAALLNLQGCASVESTRVNKDEGAEGLVYFLPRKDVTLTVTVPTPPATTYSASAAPSSAVPDTSQAFVATVPRSQIAKINSSIQVNAQGLLNSDSTGATTSNLTAILQSIAGLPGTVGAKSLAPTAAPATCSPGEHTVVVRIKEGKWLVGNTKTDTTDLCGVKFELVSPPDTLPKGVTLPDAGHSAPGLFYRVALPYVVRASRDGGDGKDGKDFIVLSPTGSPTYFLPVARAGFGSNTASFTFAEGVPTKYGQSIDSELVGVVQLPATLVSAYFEAIGKMFTTRKGPLTNEKDYLDTLNQLAITEQKRKDCAAAVDSGDAAKIKDVCSK